jgi:hypothetical protein
MAAAEVNSPLFFVLWDDLKMVSGGTAQRMAERLVRGGEKNNSGLGDPSYKRLCTAPFIQNSRLETIPTLVAPLPLMQRKKLKTCCLTPTRAESNTLYPFDGVGIYDRARFIQMGGFDCSLKDNLWQLMDFGFRSYLWGEEISVSHTLKFSYEGTPPSEDSSVSEDSLRFYLKNIAPEFQGDHAFLPLRRFFTLLLQGNLSFFRAIEHFKEGRLWVRTNSYRWRCSAKTIAKHWNLQDLSSKVSI